MGKVESLRFRSPAIRSLSKPPVRTAATIMFAPRSPWNKRANRRRQTKRQDQTESASRAGIAAAPAPTPSAAPHCGATRLSERTQPPHRRLFNLYINSNVPSLSAEDVNGVTVATSGPCRRTQTASPVSSIEVPRSRGLLFTQTTSQLHGEAVHRPLQERKHPAADAPPRQRRSDSGHFRTGRVMSRDGKENYLNIRG